MWSCSVWNREDIFIPSRGGKSVLCYRVCLASLGGMGGGREVDGKGEGRGGRSVSSSTSCFFFLDSISLRPVLTETSIHLVG